SVLTLAYGWLGWMDDWQVIRRKSNKGVSPRTKLLFQFGFGILFAGWLFITQPGELTNLLMPGGWLLPLGILFWPLVSWVLATASNATNLTDGLDGLAGGTSAIAFLAMGAIVAPTAPALGLFCAACSGGCLGFLAFNRNPARVFMGDTGSLALGAALAGVALMTQNLWSAVIISGVFLIETLSVILQVGYYKATKGPDGKGKRLFRMAPLHHHFELEGWSELRVVSTFYAVSGVLAIAALVWR
ncbi:MAG: phospho-N-acetylmuramoyl-pentapeptide-transferase, partial [Cyanobacteria bacterium P01_H01_bin.130]